MKNNVYVAIMAGGIGSRFWPASRINLPKQFLDILGVGKSLLRLTFERFLKLCPPENIFVVTNALYVDLVNAHIPEISKNQILSEPSRNNTAPCIAYTSFKIHGINQEANLIIAPSDHIILKEDEYIRNLKLALNYSKNQDTLITLGIKPTRPDTGYGYIHYDDVNIDSSVYKVIDFKEKPKLQQAEEYLLNGNYLWNAGIFIWNVNSILNAYKILSPQIYNIFVKGIPYYNTKEEQNFIDTKYPATENISIDYAILEKSNNVFTIPVDIGWSDLGTWASLYTESQKDYSGNAVFVKNIITENVKNCLIRSSENKLIVLKDINDFIIVNEADVLLIYPKSKEQEIKDVTFLIQQKYGQEYL